MINFSKISNKSIIGMILRLPLNLIPRNTTLYIMQGKLKGKKWIRGLSAHGCWLGTYEYEKQVLFSRIVKKESIVYDIGAHAGFYTLLFSKLVGSKGKVFAFEPSPRNIYYLKQHVKLNCCDNVRIIEAAVSDKNGIAFLKENITSATDYLSREGNIMVKTVSLDNLVQEGKIPPADYIKMNAEGTELLIISDAEKMLVNYKPTIFLSTHGFNVHRQCCTFLRSIGYDLQSINGKKDVNETDELLVFKK